MSDNVNENGSLLGLEDNSDGGSANHSTISEFSYEEMSFMHRGKGKLFLDNTLE